MSTNKENDFTFNFFFGLLEQDAAKRNAEVDQLCELAIGLAKMVSSRNSQYIYICIVMVIAMISVAVIFIVIVMIILNDRWVWKTYIIESLRARVRFRVSIWAIIVLQRMIIKV